MPCPPTIHDFSGQGQIALSPLGCNIIKEYRLSKAGRLSQPHIPWNPCPKNKFLEVFFCFFGNLMGQVIALVKHGQKHPFYTKTGIQIPLDALICLQELADAF
jgi:hypothetical protein